MIFFRGLDLPLKVNLSKSQLCNFRGGEGGEAPRPFSLVTGLLEFFISSKCLSLVVLIMVL